jgi:hypothetical protein
MEKPIEKKKAGRPASGKKKSKPNISIAIWLQEEAQADAKYRGMGFTEYVTAALLKEIGRGQQSSQHQPLQSLPKTKEQKAN